MKQAVTSWLQALDTDFFYAGVPRWDKCLSVSGDYLEVWCVPSATHMLCIHSTQNTFLGARVFVVFLELVYTY